MIFPIKSKSKVSLEHSRLSLEHMLKVSLQHTLEIQFLLRKHFAPIESQHIVHASTWIFTHVAVTEI